MTGEIYLHTELIFLIPFSYTLYFLYLIYKQ